MGYVDLEIKTVLICAVIGAVMGYISFLINVPYISFAAAMVVLIISALAMKKIMKTKQERGWWTSNVIVVYILSWFIVWTLFYNLRLFV